MSGIQPNDKRSLDGFAMNFKPGDKVWIRNVDADVAAGDVPVGIWAGRILGPSSSYFPEGWYQVHIEGWPPAGALSSYNAFYLYIWPRDPPQKEPKREELGSWDGCGWRPAPTKEEATLRFTRRNFEEVAGESPRFDLRGFTWSIS